MRFEVVNCVSLFQTRVAVGSASSRAFSTTLPTRRLCSRFRLMRTQYRRGHAINASAVSSSITADYRRNSALFEFTVIVVFAFNDRITSSFTSSSSSSSSHFRFLPSLQRLRRRHRMRRAVEVMFKYRYFNPAAPFPGARRSRSDVRYTHIHSLSGLNSNVSVLCQCSATSTSTKYL